MARQLLSVVGLGLLAIALSRPAAAQQLQGCEDHRSMVDKLATKFHETRAAVAINQYGWLIELFEAEDGKSWTLVGTRPGGPACVFGVGTDWLEAAPARGRSTINLPFNLSSNVQ